MGWTADAVWSPLRRMRQRLRRGLVVDVGPGVRATVLVAGSARSGTTWLGDRIASELGARVIFEPFVVDARGRPASLQAPPWREEAARRSISRYLPEDAAGDPWADGVARVLAGRVRSAWSDRTPPGLYRWRVVKAVRGNLLLGHVAARWPGLPVVWLVRDPVDVVGSQIRQSRRSWDFDWDPGCVLDQPRLMRDWLAPFEGLIRDCGDLVDRLALRWCIENYVPLRQNVEAHGVLRIGYEDLCRSEEAWERLAAHLERSGARIGAGAGRGTDALRLRGVPVPEPGQGGSGILDEESVRRVRRRVESFGLVGLAPGGERREARTSWPSRPRRG